MITYKFYEKINDEIIDIRTKVFIEEQGFVDEFDEIDNNCLFIVVYKNNKYVSTARINKVSDGLYKIGRIAVLKEYRKLHLGSLMIEKLTNKAIEFKAKKIIIGAQVQAVPFYEKNGFKVVSDIYYEEHVPHKIMEKEI